MSVTENVFVGSNNWTAPRADPVATKEAKVASPLPFALATLPRLLLPSIVGPVVVSWLVFSATMVGIRVAVNVLPPSVMRLCVRLPS